MTVVAAVSAVALPALAHGAAAPSAACRSTCFVNVEPGRFKAAGAGAQGSTLTMLVGARVKWRVPAGASHSVVAANGVFDFGVGAAPDTSFSLVPSAGRYEYRDTLGGAGLGTLVVQPRFKRRSGGEYLVSWGPDTAPPPDRVHAVRWFVIRGADIEASGSWGGAVHEGSRTFTRTERLTAATRLEKGRSFCVEVRTGRGTPTRWSGWANSCVGL
jgi:hypothetical protein